ncbi:hypothetical protein MTR_6g033445 [Medicago truncatula]|uniref:RNase H type-1 domain-containing protein n=1 Tax=Medicago truncatula TaxID=3880 RepID=A0A072U7K7_MEDTR|nr:hypothetical protein MTR_6g033445 [Medicago truncatula]
MILNVDGSAYTNPRNGGFSGLVLNHDGTFQFRFYGSVDIKLIRTDTTLDLSQKAEKGMS